LPVVVWHPPVNWPMAPHSTVAMLSQREGSAAVTLRAATATPDAPVRVRLSTDESVQTLELTSNDWRTVQVPLVSSWRFWLRQSHLLTVADQPLSGLVEVGTITLLPAGR
jgi:hypothetical protein